MHDLFYLGIALALAGLTWGLIRLAAALDGGRP
jgi:hypothetical protein